MMDKKYRGDNMKNVTVNGIDLTIVGDMDTAEAMYYLLEIEKEKHLKIRSATVVVDGEYVDIDYRFALPKFERIRRITGYLVGTTNRWNNAKQEELADRVVHK